MVTRARARNPAVTDIRVASLDEPLPYDSGRFDLVVCALAIHYAKDRAASLTEFARGLKPGGAVVLSTQHPTADWLRKGGSYFDVTLESDEWKPKGGGRRFAWEVQFWREPLTALCHAIYEAGLLIERLVEPKPAETMRERDLETYGELMRTPGFLVMRLLKPPAR